MDIADQRVKSEAVSISASFATSTGSFPPHSKITGVSVDAHVAATIFAVFVDPVNANLFTPLSQSALPVSPKPVTT
ncbi:unannotated protein [freshwater metagenome]|uniref:Unannotated protein n=1 Tax=freshwater metagenome TaxID=449393 RepID=A0A6J7QHL8_9ZZZZ